MKINLLYNYCLFNRSILDTYRPMKAMLKEAVGPGQYWFLRSIKTHID